MSAKFTANTAEIRKSAQTIEDKTQQYNTEWAKIYTEIENLRVEWEGESSETFNTQLEGYRNDFQELANILNDYAEFLITTATKIEQTEEALKSSASQLSAGR